MARDDPSRVFSKLTDEDRKSLVVKAYEQLKVSFEKYTKPSGDKTAPARTCRDLAVAHPELPSGKLKLFYYVTTTLSEILNEKKNDLKENFNQNE